MCEECEKYETCTQLCEEAEKYVNQDYVSRRGYVMYFPETGGIESWRGYTSLDFIFDKEGGHTASFLNDFGDWRKIDFSFLSYRERECLIMYYYDGMRTREIGEVFDISHKTVSEYLRRARGKCANEWKNLDFCKTNSER